METPLPVTSTTSAGQTSQKIPLPTPVSTEPSGNGTAVGAVIVVASLALLGFFLYRQRNNTNKLKAQMELLQHTPDTGDSEPEVSAYGTRDQYYKDAQIQTAYEVEARHGMTEIAGRREVAEASAVREGSELPAVLRPEDILRAGNARLRYAAYPRALFPRASTWNNSCNEKNKSFEYQNFPLPGCVAFSGRYRSRKKRRVPLILCLFFASSR